MTSESETPDSPIATEDRLRTRPARLLMLANAFPPSRLAVLRSVKFAKYLPDFGWEPIVLTPLAPDRSDATAAPPDYRMVRTGRFATPSMQVQRWYDTLRRGNTATPITESTAAGDVAGATPGEAELPRLSTRISMALRQILLWGDMPDRGVGWLPMALRHGRRLIRRHRIDAIHASGPPFSIILAGALLAKLIRKPLVADFRDTWTLDLDDPFGTIGGGFRAAGGEQRLRLARLLERWCLEQADAVLFTSRATQALYENTYPELRGCAHLIYNGIDTDDLEDGVAQCEQPTIAHIGTIHQYQWPQVRRFLEAFAEARRAGHVPAETQVVFVGVLAGVETPLRAAIAALGLDDSVKTPGRMPHREAVRWMQRSHLLLLFVGQNPYIRLSKISECVATGRAMLAFAPAGSETADEVSSYGGAVVDEIETAALAALLGRLLHAELKPDSAAKSDRAAIVAHPHPLNRRTNARQLSEILNRLTAREKSGAETVKEDESRMNR